MNNTHQAKTFVFKLFILSAILIMICVLFCYFSQNYLAEQNADAVADVPASYTVVLDAGHGGIDCGANVNGIFEKDLNLQITTKIEEFLRFFDVNVVLTRDSDNLLADSESKNKKREDLFNRVQLAKEFQLPIFVSVHMNKFPETKYKGLQVFYSPNNAYSEALALKVKSNNREYLEDDNQRSVKKADSTIYILDRLFCPAVLIECGFISNSSDMKKLCDSDYQSRLAFVIANSIIEYIGL